MRLKGNSIAVMLEQKIVGIESVDIDRYGEQYSKCNAALAFSASNSTPPWLERSNKIVAATTIESESVKVVWLLE